MQFLVARVRGGATATRSSTTMCLAVRLRWTQQDCYCRGGALPYYFFCPDGSYEIYDYRSPGELRIDAVRKPLLLGHFKTGTVMHDLVGGGALFLRTVTQPGYFSAGNPISPDGVVQDGAVYTYVGFENIYQPISAVPRGSGPIRRARAASGKSITRPPRSCRIACTFPGRIHCLPAADTIHCATITTP